eukprot:TRINITY_DN2326_c0_g1_i1.p1 TRINITY_DN2326_c0_g1~~TRINITY_DN2326_c0_g1_i1.p1  ORF type:complete len:485 (-),score=85.76 TRINITY_DN2326_c0_g1_i1:121-1521(-)
MAAEAEGERDRHRRRRDEGGGGSRRTHGEKRPSRSRSRRRRKKVKEDDGSPATSLPPVDWRGPPGPPRGPPPQGWRGPSAHDWRGPHPMGPHAGLYPPPHGVADPRWYAERPPPRQMSPYQPQMRHWGPPPPGMGGTGLPPPRPDEVGRFCSEPPSEWRGPASTGMRPPGAYDARGPGVDPWAASRPPPGPNAWGTGPPQGPGSGGGAGAGSVGPAVPGGGGPPPGSDGGPASSMGFPGYQQPAIGNVGDAEKKALEGPGCGNAADGGLGSQGLAITNGSVGGVGSGSGGLPTAGGGSADFDDEDGCGETKLPVPRTAAERLRGVPLVRVALSQATLARLRAAGVDVDAEGAERAAATWPRVNLSVGNAASVAEVAAVARARCVELGLDGGNMQKARTPSAMPIPQRLPVCTLDQKHVGLWERFRQRCGTPALVDSPAVPCELRKSRMGGSVLVPIVVPVSEAEKA